MSGVLNGYTKTTSPSDIAIWQALLEKTIWFLNQDAVPQL